MTSPLPDEERDESAEEIRRDESAEEIRRDESAEEIRRDEEFAGRPAELWYANVGEFVTDRLAYFVPSPTPESGQVWCPQWFRHPVALSRLDALWRAWEALRWDAGLGMSSWWINHFEPHLRALSDPVTGPFAHCVDGHRNNEPLLLAPAPEGLFREERWRTSQDPFALD
ncbi:DUF4913 domain-containing protein [Streptomyces sp. NPDC058252]|uniref:DUF4913 domain-containing protein n=1 Tax=Streptomyces sp. NPDC058252 TaxID=3346405 RepID=UPI0036EA56CF